MSQETAAPVVPETKQLGVTDLDRFYKLSVVVLAALNGGPSSDSARRSDSPVPLPLLPKQLRQPARLVVTVMGWSVLRRSVYDVPLTCERIFA